MRNALLVRQDTRPESEFCVPVLTATTPFDSPWPHFSVP